MPRRSDARSSAERVYAVQRVASDPTLATSVHEICNYTAEDIRFGMRYADAVTTEEDGTLVADLTKSARWSRT